MYHKKYEIPSRKNPKPDVGRELIFKTWTNTTNIKNVYVLEVGYMNNEWGFW